MIVKYRSFKTITFVLKIDKDLKNISKSKGSDLFERLVDFQKEWNFCF